MEKKICDLSDHLLVQILLLLPTKEAIATTVLSKRWRYVWTMLPKLEFKDEGNEIRLGCFIDKTLQLHKAPKLESLVVQLGEGCCSDDVDVGKWIENAVHRCVHDLLVELSWIAEPTRFPKCLYTCHTLTSLTLSDKILVDVSFPASLPSLMFLELSFVVYKDEDSLVRLLSSSPVLKCLAVRRSKIDNLKHFTVKVPSLKILHYKTTWSKADDSDDDDDDDLIRSFVIDSPALMIFKFSNYWEDYCLIENMPCLLMACINFVDNPDDKFLKSLSSVTILKLYFFIESMVVCCNAITFSRLREFIFHPHYQLDWLEPLMFFIQNSPKMKNLAIFTETDTLSPSWKQPSSIPGCLSSHLEIVRWKYYRGREGEKQLLTYILANSKCLKTVEIALEETSNLGHLQKEIESMPRISTSALLLFPTEIDEPFFW